MYIVYVRIEGIAGEMHYTTQTMRDKPNVAAFSILRLQSGNIYDTSENNLYVIQWNLNDETISRDI